MKILVGAAMLAVLIATGLEAMLLAADALGGDYGAVWEYLLVEVDSQPPAPAIAWLTALVAVVTWALIMLAFWPLHQLIWASTLSFRFVGQKLKHSAYACFGFWLGSTVMFVIMPTIVIWVWDATAVDPGAILPIGFETTFLILSLIFVTIGQTLERAEEIEDEINQIL